MKSTALVLLLAVVSSHLLKNKKKQSDEDLMNTCDVNTLIDTDWDKVKLERDAKPAHKALTQASQKKTRGADSTSTLEIETMEITGDRKRRRRR